MNRMKKRWLLLPLLVMGFAACTQTKDDTGAPPSVETEKLLNVTYSTHERNQMDVYLAANRNANAPFIIFIHGGAWTTGSKADFNSIQDAMLAQGINSASINYRYVNANVHVDELMQDVNNAVGSVIASSSGWVTRKNKIILCGASAGAHMALLYAYKYDAANNIGGVITMAGPTDVGQAEFLDYATSIGLKTNLENLAGATYTKGQPVDAKFAAASPINYIKNVPTLVIHGTADEVVPYIQAQSLISKLIGLNVTYKLVELSGDGHDLGITKPENVSKLLTEITSWTNQYGK